MANSKFGTFHVSRSEVAKRKMSMMRLRRGNPNGQKVSLFRLRRTPVSMMRLRRKISQLRLKKSLGGGGNDLDCELMPERCEELFGKVGSMSSLKAYD